MDYSKLLFTIPAKDHSVEKLKKTLTAHPEVKFVSVVGVDLSGHSTDEKIPIREFLKDIKAFITKGIQTDGSAVVLPNIADLSNGRVDLIPDTSVNWYVDYNLESRESFNADMPCGTLCIPAYLKHNGKTDVGSRYMLFEAEKTFKDTVLKTILEHPYVLSSLGIKSFNDIDSIELTGATELEFWVQTPEDKANREQLSISQELKEQYWKRTTGPVRTALEQTLIYLDNYGLEVEMGHKEVGGIIAKLGASGHYDHIMEQLEIDWKYDSLLQSSDNEYHIKNVITDIFRANGLDVTFMAKPVIGVAGSGEHHHLGAAIKLKTGKNVNLYNNYENDSYLSPIGFGALMGLLKNYEAVNTYIACSNDALNRLKPGFEAPVCVVTSLGKDIETPSRNRTVLVGVIRDFDNPLSTRFELRSPCPNNNCFLVFATAYLAMLDGIIACLEKEKTAKDLEKSISKKLGAKDFYLEKDREYRSEMDVFEAFNQEERNTMFGKAPGTVFETFENAASKEKCLLRCPAFTADVISSYKEAMLLQWVMELRDRLIPEAMNFVRQCKPVHNEESKYDAMKWKEIKDCIDAFAITTTKSTSLLHKIVEALDSNNLKLASDLQKEAQETKEKIQELYSAYEKNLI